MEFGMVADEAENVKDLVDLVHRKSRVIALVREFVVIFEPAHVEFFE
jgi:hypothetical protein